MPHLVKPLAVRNRLLTAPSGGDAGSDALLPHHGADLSAVITPSSAVNAVAPERPLSSPSAPLKWPPACPSISGEAVQDAHAHRPQVVCWLVPLCCDPSRGVRFPPFVAGCGAMVFDGGRPPSHSRGGNGWGGFCRVHQRAVHPRDLGRRGLMASSWCSPSQNKWAVPAAEGVLELPLCRGHSTLYRS